MSGHSKWHNIKLKKGKVDAQRGALFTKLSKEIILAAKGGSPDPEANYRLKMAVEKARENNVPQENIKRAIARATNAEGQKEIEEIRYEGYGPANVAVVVDAATDNRNRTASDLRSAFNKYGGALGETNSVSFLFNRLGVVTYPASLASADDMLEAAIEAGAENVESNETEHEVTTGVDDFFAVRDALEARFGAAESAKLDWRPTLLVTLDEARAASLMKLLDVLDENADVQNVYANFDIPDAVMELL